VATNVGELPQIITNDKNGLVVPPNNLVKLASAIQYLLDNESARQKFGKEGRRIVIKDFSSRVVAKRLGQIYNQHNAY